jgi:hypothetical protein
MKVLIRPLHLVGHVLLSSCGASVSASAAAVDNLWSCPCDRAFSTSNSITHGHQTLWHGRLPLSTQHHVAPRSPALSWRNILLPPPLWNIYLKIWKNLKMCTSSIPKYLSLWLFTLILIIHLIKKIKLYKKLNIYLDYII